MPGNTQFVNNKNIGLAENQSLSSGNEYILESMCTRYKLNNQPYRHICKDECPAVSNGAEGSLLPALYSSSSSEESSKTKSVSVSPSFHLKYPVKKKMMGNAHITTGYDGKKKLK